MRQYTPDTTTPSLFDTPTSPTKRKTRTFPTDEKTLTIFKVNFWRYVQKPKDAHSCWEWEGSKLKKGYGSFSTPNGRFLAHRFSYFLLHGPIPEGLDVCHNCPDGDNPSCVNPNHLFVGTRTDNMQDCIKKGRNRPRRGEDNPWARLTEDQIPLIRNAYKKVGRHGNGVELARQYGVSKQTILAIVHRKKWSHIP